MKKILSSGVSTAALTHGQSPEIDKLLRSSLLAPIIAYGEGDGGDGGEGGDDGGDDNGIDPNNPVIKELIAKAVGEATKGLKAKNDELLGEKKKIKEERDSFMEAVGGEEGLERLRKQREAAERSEVDKLLADGKYDEWFEQKADSMRNKHQKELDALNTVVGELTKERDAAVSTLTNYRVNGEIDKACDSAAVKPAYREAIRRLVSDRVKLEEDEEGNAAFVVYEEDGKSKAYGPKAKPMSVEELIDSLRDKMGELFQPSTGGGASGGGKAGGGVANPFKRGSADWNITEQGRITRENPELAKRLKAEAGL